EETPLDEQVVEEAPPPAPTPLRSVPSPAAAKPSLSVVPPPGRAADGGEALLREALSTASRDVIEKIAWEVVPELAETIIREELEQLIKGRGAESLSFRGLRLRCLARSDVVSTVGSGSIGGWECWVRN